MAYQSFARSVQVMGAMLLLVAAFLPLRAVAQDDSELFEPVDGKRVALVIGNSDYQEEAAWQDLPNAVRDARGIAEELSRPSRGRARFDVDLVIDADFEALRSALRKFAAMAQDADIAVVYYSGHGFEYNLDNYLVPVNAPPVVTQRRLPSVHVNMSEVVKAATAKKMSIFFLDACRTNEAVINTSNDRSGERAALFGAINAPQSAVFYASAMGESAYDAAPRGAPLSPFATAVIEYVARPNLDIPYVFTGVRHRVSTATRIYDPSQTPQFAASWARPFYFTPAARFSAQRQVMRPTAPVISGLPSTVAAARPPRTLDIAMAVLEKTDEPLLVLQILDEHPPARLRQMSEAGEPLAGYILGYMYTHGVGVTRDHAKARLHLEKAAESEHPAALLELAYFLEYHGRPGEKERALTLYRAAAAKDFAKARSHYAEVLRTGRLGPRDGAEARRLFRAAADAGHPYAHFMLASLGEEQELHIAALKRLSEAGDADGDHWLCQFSVSALDIDGQFDHCLAAAKAGYSAARAHSAVSYAEGRGTEVSRSKAAYWARLALGSPNLDPALRRRIEGLAE